MSGTTAPGRDLLSNQFDYDASNQAMDSDVRVLQARDPSGRPFATMLDFSAHATVLGSSNTKVTGDVKVGDKVHITYTMSATNIEVKAGKGGKKEGAKAAPTP